MIIRISKRIVNNIFILFLFVTVACTNEKTQNENFADVNSILLDHENNLRQVVDKFKDDKKKKLLTI